jgi:predicted amidophosphoribosyltransferase
MDAGAVRCLLERREGEEQKGLGRFSRADNLKGAFAVRRGVSVPRACIVLDDVSTTGSTLKECAHVLKEAGVEEVTCATAALDL